jgi:hypothetical protein
MADMKPEEITFDVYYRTGHTYTETWHRETLYCPGCGARSVWVANSGDYELGEERICTACGVSFHLPTGCEVSTESIDRGRVAVLRGEGFEVRQS